MHEDGQLNGKTGLDVGVEDNPYYLRRRRQETSALAAAGAWLAVTQRNATAEGLLRKLEAMGMLPAGSVIAADKGNALATPYGALIFHYRAAPIGVEALSLGRDKAAGPALIVRLAADMPGGDAARADR